MPTTISQLELTETEAAETRKLLDEITADHRMLDQSTFIEHAYVLAQELPRRVRETFYGFKRAEAAPVLHVTGNPVLAGGPGSTPDRYVETEPGFTLNDAQILHGLYGSLLGEAVGFTSQRGGSLFNTIVPFQELMATANSSSGSRFDFGFHIEDAFHPMRAEFVGLACMRNDEGAATTISCVDGIDLTAEERDVLFEPRFKIGHNPIHVTSGVVSEDRHAILFGHRDRPYVTVNFTTLEFDDYEGLERQALDKLLRHFEGNRASLVLRSRDYVYIDNYRCVHARDAFKPFFGPGARWLSRVVFTSDLRKSRALRKNVLTRAIAA
jgi:L-asparagine oxygenase